MASASSATPPCCVAPAHVSSTTAFLKARRSTPLRAPHREDCHQVAVRVERVVDVRRGLREQHTPDGALVTLDIDRPPARGRSGAVARRRARIEISPSGKLGQVGGLVEHETAVVDVGLERLHRAQI